MLRVGWQYNPPPLAFQCVSLFLSVFIIIFFLPLYHLSRSLAPFLVGKRQRVHTQGSKQDKALRILKYISFFLFHIVHLNVIHNTKDFTFGVTS